jgi:microcystin-dependent protein
MSEPFVAEIRILPYDFAPRGWADCAGQVIAISQNTALFSLLGVQYGGNGATTFQLPNLGGRVPISFGQGPGLTPRTQGETGGAENETLTQQQIPAHSHQALAFGGNGNAYGPANDVWAADAAGGNLYGPSGNTTMSPNTLGPNGGNQPHANMQPYLAMRYCIALQGIFPPRS